ncbi:hypothetical protein [Thermomonospora cellulosilytica]|uniref:Uncharacterized protein n=1 Tax=Thermomonospora cellulosilytica TaxID=1411118 RepID=A0A7W3N1Y3_9ACTN|nr:hypothetical protein [Thermomonospora cellulosilytica]MBA9005989.1 hypothetical protein [Thermomonospora cellulosilytica]
MIDITRDSYPGVLQALASLCGQLLTAVNQVDLARMRQICEEFQATAPVLAPSDYQQGGMTRLDDQATFLRALEEFVGTLRTLDRRPTAAADADARQEPQMDADSRVINTGHGTLRVPGDILRTWEQFGWPTEDALKRMVQAGTVEAIR